MNNTNKIFDINKGFKMTTNRWTCHHDQLNIPMLTYPNYDDDFGGDEDEEDDGDFDANELLNLTDY